MVIFAIEIFFFKLKFLIKILTIYLTKLPAYLPLIPCILHGVQLKMISVDNFFPIFEIIIFCFVVAICDLVHAVEATFGLP